MNIADFITELYCKIDDGLPAVPQHPQAVLSISELVTIGVLHAMKNVKQRPFYHWLKDNYGHLFPRLPKRSRLFSRLQAQRDWTGYFLAQPTILGVGDSYGVELRHPIREGRREGQIGKKGVSNHRWIVGGKLGIVQNQWGLITDWDCAGANVHDQTFLPLLAQYDGKMIVLADTRLSSSQRGSGQRQNLSSRRVERADGSGNHFLHADQCMGHQRDASSHLGRV